MNVIPEPCDWVCNKCDRVCKKAEVVCDDCGNGSAYIRAVSDVCGGYCNTVIDSDLDDSIEQRDERARIQAIKRRRSKAKTAAAKPHKKKAPVK